jgi:hypothetical protein
VVASAIPIAGHVVLPSGSTAGRSRRSRHQAAGRHLADTHDRSAAAVLALQRSAGNRATATLLGRRTVTVQRHASFEHALLGDVEPSKLASATGVKSKNRSHVLSQQFRQTMFFSKDPHRDPRSSFPDVRWIKLRGSGLWLSYGELNALADYLPDSDNIDSLPVSVVRPVLQRMRSVTSGQVLRFIFAGQASAGGYELAWPVRDEKAMQRATGRLGANAYFGLVARNACHFAPFSWHRWARFHNEAREHALAHHRSRESVRPLKDLDTDSPEHLRQAWLKNGYGDHFLQDSFAAGHLVNKTLVMQWFVDYVNGMASKWWDVLGPVVWWGFDNTAPWYGMPSDQVMTEMGSAAQPGIAGRHLYGRPPGDVTTTSDDRMLGESATDPQSAQERWSHRGRLGGSGVQATRKQSKEQNYRTYLAFLNSSFLQLAAGAVHDHFNEEGLSVANERGDTFTVGGDDTMLAQSSRLGAQLAAEASASSRRAIEELATTGATDVTVEGIWKMMPTSIWTKERSAWKKRSLADWHTDVLKKVCWTSIFPDVVDGMKSKTVRAMSPELSPAGVQMDNVPAPPVPSSLGDFVVPAGATRAG